MCRVRWCVGLVKVNVKVNIRVEVNVKVNMNVKVDTKVNVKDESSQDQCAIIIIIMYIVVTDGVSFRGEHTIQLMVGRSHELPGGVQHQAPLRQAVHMGSDTKHPRDKPYMQNTTYTGS